MNYFKRTFILLGLFFVISGAVENISAQKVRLRAQVTPECDSVAAPSRWKFADIYADGNIAVQGKLFLSRRVHLRYFKPRRADALFLI